MSKKKAENVFYRAQEEGVPAYQHTSTERLLAHQNEPVNGVCEPSSASRRGYRMGKLIFYNELHTNMTNILLYDNDLPTHQEGFLLRYLTSYPDSYPGIIAQYSLLSAPSQHTVRMLTFRRKSTPDLAKLVIPGFIRRGRCSGSYPGMVGTRV